jgi:hypothetical protein
MGRLIGGIIAGIVSAGVTIVIIELISHAIYPPPPGLDINNHEQVGAYIMGMPGGAHALVALAWLGGAADGGLVAALVSRRHWTIWLIAALVIAAAAYNLLTYTHPLALQFAAVVAPLLGALLASFVERKMRGPDAGTAA